MNSCASLRQRSREGRLGRIAILSCFLAGAVVEPQLSHKRPCPHETNWWMVDAGLDALTISNQRDGSAIVERAMLAVEEHNVQDHRWIFRRNRAGLEFMNQPINCVSSVRPLTGLFAVVSLKEAQSRDQQFVRLFWWR